jgi:hypothetical protein
MHQVVHAVESEIWISRTLQFGQSCVDLLRACVLGPRLDELGCSCRVGEAESCQATRPTADATHRRDASVFPVTRRVTSAEVDVLRSAVSLIDAGGNPQRTLLAQAARTACALLALRFPGGSVELRIPPFAAVQLGIGERGRHTRGTPPNVVQTDPVTLLRLAGGSLTWAQAREQHLVQASGIYAELAELWPMPELR